jgi:hypothetical protein
MTTVTHRPIPPPPGQGVRFDNVEELIDAMGVPVLRGEDFLPGFTLSLGELFAQVDRPGP